MLIMERGQQMFSYNHIYRTLHFRTHRIPLIICQFGNVILVWREVLALSLIIHILYGPFVFSSFLLVYLLLYFIQNYDQ